MQLNEIKTSRFSFKNKLIFIQLIGWLVSQVLRMTISASSSVFLHSKRLIHTSLSSYINGHLDKYILDIQTITPPIPYLKVMYPELYYEDSIPKAYDRADFSLDMSDLRGRYLFLQQKFHPDSIIKWTSYYNMSKELENISHLVGDAYFNLRDTIKRAEHWLYIHQAYSRNPKCICCNSDDDGNSKKHILPSEFLEEMMNLHESVAENKEHINTLVELKKKKIIDSIPQLIHNRAWGILSTSLIKYKYLDSISSRI